VPAQVLQQILVGLVGQEAQRQLTQGGQVVGVVSLTRSILLAGSCLE
jgi:hypothetical protein